MTGQPEVLDAKRIEQLRALARLTRASVLEELFGVFLKDASGCIGRIRAALDAKDARALEFSAHRFKGACLSSGATRLADACRSLEALGHQGTTEGADEFFDRLEPELELTRAEMARVLEEDAGA